MPSSYKDRARKPITDEQQQQQLAGQQWEMLFGDYQPPVGVNAPALGRADSTAAAAGAGGGQARVQPPAQHDSGGLAGISEKVCVGSYRAGMVWVDGWGGCVRACVSTGVVMSSLAVC